MAVDQICLVCVLQAEATVESEDPVTPESSDKADKSGHDPDDEL